MPSATHIGTCVKCMRVVGVEVDGLGRAWVVRHRTVGRADCSGGGLPPRGYISKED
jgi:hypothetical protein